MKLSDAFEGRWVTVKGEYKLVYVIDQLNNKLVRIRPIDKRENYTRWIHVSMLEPYNGDE